jgi:hypothetical protein
MTRERAIFPPKAITVDKTFHIELGTGRFIQGANPRMLRRADVAKGLSRIVSHSDEYGNLLDSKTFSPTGGWRTACPGFARSHERLNAAMDTEVQGIIARHSAADITIRRRFASISATEDGGRQVFSYGVRHINELPLFFKAASSVRGLSTPQKPTSWEVFIDTDRTELPPDRVKLFGAYQGNDGALTMIGRAVERGYGAFTEPFSEGLPLDQAWRHGALAVHNFIENAAWEFSRSN